MVDFKKFLTMFCYCFAFGQLGFAFASMGPILPILVEQVSQPLEYLGYVFPGRSVAYLLGSLTGGLIIHKVNGHWLIASGLFFSGIGTCLIPFVNQLWILSLCIAVQGVAMGFLDTGVNVLTASLYGEKAAPYLQLIHFSFGFGAFISPLLIELSLVKAETYQWAFVGVSPTFILIAIILVLLPTPKAEENKAIKTKKGGYSVRQWSLVLMGSFLLLLYVGCELTISGYLLVYCQNKLGMSQSDGDYTSFSFWFAMAVGRLLAIPISMKVSGFMMLLVNFLGCLISLITIVVFQDSSLVIKICMPILGLSMSSVYPSVMTMIEQYMQLTGKFATLLVIGGAVGELAIPFIMAAIIDSPNHPWIALMYLLLSSNAVSLLVLFVFRIVGKQVRDSKRASQISFAKLPSMEQSLSEFPSSEMSQIKNYVKLQEEQEDREDREDRENENDGNEMETVHHHDFNSNEETVPLKK